MRLRDVRFEILLVSRAEGAGGNWQTCATNCEPNTIKKRACIPKGSQASLLENELSRTVPAPAVTSGSSRQWAGSPSSCPGEPERSGLWKNRQKLYRSAGPGWKAAPGRSPAAGQRASCRGASSEGPGTACGGHGLGAGRWALGAGSRQGAHQSADRVHGRSSGSWLPPGCFYAATQHRT